MQASLHDFYQQPLKRSVRQGDIALCEFHQLRSRSGEGAGPGPQEVANEDVPYFGAYRDWPLEIDRPGTSDKATRVLRVWFGPVMVVHQNCEIEYADSQDARLQVAPVVSTAHWPEGPWEEIRRRSLPSFFHLPPIAEDEAPGLALETPWPEAAVALASTTCVSRGMVKPYRILSLSPESLPSLQESIVRFTTVRGWGSQASLEQLVGKQIVAVKQTAETVPGPSPLAKVFLRDESGGPDEITVVWGVRRTGRPAAG